MLMMIVNWLLSALLLMAVANILPGITLENYSTALVAILVMSLVNALVQPLIVLLTLPINILTLGLFSFVIAAAMFGLSAYLVPGFQVDNWFSALIGALLLGVLTSVLHAVFPRAAMR